MKFYGIRCSGNINIIGHYPQTKSVKQNCDVFNEPAFIEHAHFKKIEFKPITANAVLFDTSKPTDLIDVTGMGFTRRLLMSGKLKQILERSRNSGLQFFPSAVIHKNKTLTDYWVLNAYEADMQFIDFTNSKVYETKNVFDKVTLLDIRTSDGFDTAREHIEAKGYPFGILLDTIRIAPETTTDFFILRYVEGGVKYIASENLRREIETAGCTGIEFQPVELSLPEWLQGGIREKEYGKAG